jgi:dipeptidyl aminopeptidase/acylaminoacyl peptidase
VPGTDLVTFTIERTKDIGASSTLAVASLGPTDPAWRPLIADVMNGRAVASDLIVFSRGSDLYAVRFNAARLVVDGAPMLVASDVAQARGMAHVAASATGTFVRAIREAENADAQLAWWATGSLTVTGIDPNGASAPTLSPDGRRVALVRAEGSRSDLWVSDVERGASTRLTHSGTASSPVWSADGQRVFYAHRADGAYEIWARDADAAGPAARLFGGERHAFPLAAAPDGRTLLFAQRSDATHSDIWALPIGGGPPTPLLTTPFEEEAASYSPDGTLIALQSTETGRAEIYVQRLRDGRRVIVSADGGANPRWSSDGVFFESRGRLLRAVIVEERDGLRVASLTDVMELGGRTLAGVAGRPLLFRRSDTPRPSSRALVDVEFARAVRAALAPAVSVPR